MTIGLAIDSMLHIKRIEVASCSSTALAIEGAVIDCHSKASVGHRHLRSFSSNPKTAASGILSHQDLTTDWIYLGIGRVFNEVALCEGRQQDPRKAQALDVP